MLFGPWRTGLALPDTGLDHCPRIQLSCFRARVSGGGGGCQEIPLNLQTNRIDLADKEGRQSKKSKMLGTSYMDMKAP